jgi:hypothetical protein
MPRQQNQALPHRDNSFFGENYREEEAPVVEDVELKKIKATVYAIVKSSLFLRDTDGNEYRLTALGKNSSVKTGDTILI